MGGSGGLQRGLLAVLTSQTPLRVRTKQPAAAAVVGTIEYGPYLVPDERKPYAASGSTRAPPGWSASPAKRTGFC